MAFEDYKQKDAVIVIYTGEGKGKTSASIGLMARALGRGWSVAYIQFIKHWKVGEHDFISMVQPVFKDKLLFYKGGKGFFNAPEGIQAEGVSEAEHKQAAKDTLNEALKAVNGSKYNLVICDEINNAVHEGLITKSDMKKLISAARDKHVSLCLTGRNFPEEFLPLTDIATNMTKIKHHFDDKFLANKGIDY